jgi:hypothetical protein
MGLCLIVNPYNNYLKQAFFTGTDIALCYFLWMIVYYTESVLNINEESFIDELEYQ